MEIEKMLNKNVLLIFEDGRQGASRKGKITAVDKEFLSFESSEHGSELIPVTKIIRVKNLEDENYV